MLTEDLIKFEEEIAEIYKRGLIRAPVHLRDGNEEYLIDIFKNIQKQDFCYSTWSSHLHCLLKGVPVEQVKRKILDGHSITLHFPEYNFYTSAIVGGIAPIAVGTAHSIVLNKEDRRVWCFIGDMALHNGVVYDSILFSIKNDLPVTWVIEDNNKSVCTITSEVGLGGFYLFSKFFEMNKESQNRECDLKYYHFQSKWPHSGVNQFISF